MSGGNCRFTALWKEYTLSWHVSRRTSGSVRYICAVSSYRQVWTPGSFTPFPGSDDAKTCSWLRITIRTEQRALVPWRVFSITRKWRGFVHMRHCVILFYTFSVFGFFPLVLKGRVNSAWNCCSPGLITRSTVTSQWHNVDFLLVYKVFVQQRWACSGIKQKSPY